VAERLAASQEGLISMELRFPHYVKVVKSSFTTSVRGLYDEFVLVHNLKSSHRGQVFTF
jgi:hypothetical protein